MRVLLTGGTGFVGINIVERLLDEGIDLVIYALNPIAPEADKSFQHRPGLCTFVQGNILDQNHLESTIEKYSIDTMIHAAVITPDINREVQESLKIVNVNCMGTVTALEAARKFDIKKFVYLSSSSVYGKTLLEKEALAEETSLLKPESLYEISKFSAEHIAMRYKQLLGMNIIAARIGSVFGPWEHFTGVRDTLSAPFQTTRLAILKQEVFLSGPGRRDWVYSRDVANAIYALVESETLSHEIYNIGSTFNWSVEEWCQLLLKKYEGFHFSIVDDSQEELINVFGRMEEYAPLKMNRLLEDAGYRPQYDLHKAFQDYMKWIEDTSDFWMKDNN